MTEGSRQSGGSQKRPPRPPSSTPGTRAPRTRRLPKVGRHSSGEARVTLGGVVHDLGRDGSLEAQRRYPERPHLIAPHGSHCDDHGKVART
jgi:hypothetical protein